MRLRPGLPRRPVNMQTAMSSGEAPMRFWAARFNRVQPICTAVRIVPCRLLQTGTACSHAHSWTALVEQSIGFHDCAELLTNRREGHDNLM